MTAINWIILIGGLIVSIITAAVGVVANVPPGEVVILIFTQAILTVCLETRFAKTASDTLLGSLANPLRKDSNLLAHALKLIGRALGVRKLESDFMLGCLNRYLHDVETTLESMGTGTFVLDLGPGGRFFSEAEAIDFCKKTYRCTSMVSPIQYWASRTGKDALENSRRRVREGKPVSRIFIEHGERMGDLKAIVEEHRTAGVTCYVATWESLHHSLRRDFALIDDNSVGVELKLDEDRAPIEARYHIAEKDRSHKEIGELARVWEALMKEAKPADRFLGEVQTAHGVRPRAADSYN